MKGVFTLLSLAATVQADWVITFEDDFSGSTLNASSWTVANRDPTKSQYDGHDAMFVADNVAVSDGNLIITTYYAPNSTLNGVTYNMLSGWIDTEQKRNQTLLGQSTRFEASIKMPNANATGAWPAWWLLPEGLVGNDRHGARRTVFNLYCALIHSAGQSEGRLTLLNGMRMKAISRGAIQTCQSRLHSPTTVSGRGIQCSSASVLVHTDTQDCVHA